MLWLQPLEVGSDSRGELVTVGSNDFSDLRTVLDELESGHTTDGLALGEGSELIDIDVEEKGLRVLGSQSLVDGGDLLARSAPGGREVDNDELVGSGGVLGVVLSGVNVDDRHDVVCEGGE